MKASVAIDSAFAKEDAAIVNRILCVPAQNADVIVCFCGLPRNVDVMVRLWGEGFAPKIDCLGNNSYPCKKDPTQDAIQYAKACEKQGVPKKALFADNTLTNTKEAADFEVSRASSKGWNSILYVAQGYHLPRAFATFVQSLTRAKLEKKIKVIPQQLPMDDWTKIDEDMLTSWVSELQDEELGRITKYQAKGDVASWQQVEEYLDFWKL